MWSLDRHQYQVLPRIPCDASALIETVLNAAFDQKWQMYFTGQSIQLPPLVCASQLNRAVAWKAAHDQQLKSGAYIVHLDYQFITTRWCPWLAPKNGYKNKR